MKQTSQAVILLKSGNGVAGMRSVSACITCMLCLIPSLFVCLLLLLFVCFVPERFHSHVFDQLFHPAERLGEQRVRYGRLYTQVWKNEVHIHCFNL